MFTTTNVAATTASAGGGGGPITAVIPQTFQLNSVPITGSSSSASSSTTTAAWRLTPTSSTTYIKQPSMVSIVNGNMNVVSTTTLPMNSTGVTMPTMGNKIYIATTTTNSSPLNSIPSGTRILQTPQTIRIIPSPLHTSISTPTLTILNNNNKTPTIINNTRQIITSSISSISTNSKPGFCIETGALGRLAQIPIQQQNTNLSLVQQTRSLTPVISSKTTETIDEQEHSSSSCIVSNDNNSVLNNSQDEEIEIIVNNVVATFALGCKLNLRKIAMEASNVIYKREQSMVLMKMRHPNCSANIWSSGKVTITGTTRCV
ncbi:hypothetical protein I4U23_010082 [Adineta vaga]|nr:hypothetical protein I4U23_010082 [Adineta vaga]